MKKYVYMAVMFSIVLGLYIPRSLQFIATIAIISSMATYVGIYHKQFFPAKGGDDNE